MFTGNEVSAHDPNGEPLAFDSALHVLDCPLTMRDSVVTDNRVTSHTQTTEDIGPAGGAVELDGGGTLERRPLVGNASQIRTTDGASATGPAA